jgi:hypothetical protein
MKNDGRALTNKKGSKFPDGLPEMQGEMGMRESLRGCKEHDPAKKKETVTWSIPAGPEGNCGSDDLHRDRDLGNLI